MGTLSNPYIIAHDQLADKLRAALGLSERETPFPWQELLLRKFVAGEIPHALDIPTGLGKTAVMAVWLVARAAGALMPRRLVYVVDRRAVVDQATDVAVRLRVLVERDEQLQRALGLVRPLPISTLRGQFVDNKQWLEDPSTPAIVLGTVDMIGSRLLFGGYGVSQKMRPYHAGFLGADSLIVLDEAHLVQPFERLIEQIAEGVDTSGRSLAPDDGLGGVVPRLRCLSLSATGRERSVGYVFGLSDEDRGHPVVEKRLSAVKRLVLREQVSSKDLPEALADEAWALSLGGTQPARVIVFCNSREHAQKVQEALKRRASGPETIDTELFVGGRRVFERDTAAGWLRERGFLAGTRATPERAAFVMATSAGEVGVDLDADHAVCDLVSWERMVQRFGRVNRRGDGNAQVVVVPPSRDEKTAQAIAKLVRWRSWTERPAAAVHGDESPNGTESDAESEGEGGPDDEQSGKEPKLKVEERRAAESAIRLDAALALIRRLRVRQDGYDVSPGALLDLRRRAAGDSALLELMRRATTPAPLHPPVTRALVEAWSMTSLDEHTGRPKVEPWIRGWPEEEDEPRTTVVWRRYLPVADGGKLLGPRDLATFREGADPHLVEQLETETWRMLPWLVKRVKATKLSEHPDVKAGGGGSVSGERSLQPSDVIAVLLDSRQDNRVVLAVELSRTDQRTALEYELQGATLIVDRQLGGLRDGLLADDADDEIKDVTEQDATADGETPAEGRRVPFRIRRIVDGAESQPSAGWRVEASIPVKSTDEGVTEWLNIESEIGQVAGSEEGRSSAKHAQLLDEHQEWVEQEATRIGERLALPRDCIEMLSIAARLHDEGKQATRWQQAFRAPSGGKPPFYAKTTRAPDLKVLDGYRHELGSLPYAEAHARVVALSPELRELCLHLIAAHHGNARPLIRTVGATEPPTRLVERAQQIALRFAALEKQWGPWGLAWWEALLRAADQQASRRNDSERGSRG